MSRGLGWRVGLAILGFGLWSEAVSAETVTFTLPPDYGDLAVTWSATPTDLPEDADILQAMIMQPEAQAGPWTVTLKPGAYDVTAYSDTAMFEMQVTVAAGSDQAYQVAPLQLSATVPFRCPDAETCQFKDDSTRLLFDLPKGWAAEQPYHVDEGGGKTATEVSAVFFQDIEGDGADVWFLNPPEWGDGEGGPCRTVSLGQMCTFELSTGAEAAFKVIAPSLRISTAP